MSISLTEPSDRYDSIHFLSSWQIAMTFFCEASILRAIPLDFKSNHRLSLTSGCLHRGKITKVNHSCSPNCGISLNITGAHDFIAMQAIEIGDEITFEYAMRNYCIEYFPYKCRCGSKNCRTSITGWKNLPDSFKSKYKGFVAPYLIEIDLKAKEVTLGP